ncbi:hypothetical protein [Cyanobium sp. NIES-981]|uniref:hypothetical protein n=1 Tax=Cyanobium sp. NIES-981 TaxID=1851505 RepID=UPI0007DCC19D|nr:hypothetical protein [Cyanobium sp. NIES-981]SBO42418.1 conserved protein of unknown function [Cyanobium sp. NIES-981]
MAIACLPSRSREPRSPRQQLGRWQVCRSWARLIREAEALWLVDVRPLRRLAAQELGQLHHEVPAALRHQVNRWLQGFRVHTRLITAVLPAGLGGGEGREAQAGSDPGAGAHRPGEPELPAG